VFSKVEDSHQSSRLATARAEQLGEEGVRVRRFHEEAWNKGNVATVDEFMAADYVEHPVLSGLPPGTEGLKQAITTYHTAFPDVKAILDDIHLR